MSVDRSILKGTLLVGLVSALAQGVGFLFTIVFGWLFGVTEAADAYYLAMVLPTFVINLAAGAIKIVFVPLFVQERVKDGAGVDALVGTIHMLFLAGSVVAMLVTALVQPLLISDPGTAALVRQLTYVVLPVIPVGMVFSLFSGVYNAHQRFALAEAALTIKSLCAVVVLLMLTTAWGILGAAVAQVVGHIAAFALVALVLRRRLQIRVWPQWSPTPAVWRLLRSAALPISSYVLLQLNPVVARVILAALPSGNVSILSYAERLASIPAVVLGAGFTTVLLSHWALLSAEGDRQGLRTSLSRALDGLMVVLFPLATALILLRDPITTIAYGRGAFDLEALSVTADTFGILVTQVVPLCLHMVIVRVLLAEKAFRSMFWLSLLSAMLSLGLMTVLGIWLGYGAPGVATAILLNSTVVMTVTAIWVHKRHVPIKVRGLLASAARVVSATVVMGGVIVGLKMILPFDKAVATLLSTTVVCATAAIAYLGTLHLMRHPHTRWVISELRAWMRPAQG